MQPRQSLVDRRKTQVHLPGDGIAIEIIEVPKIQYLSRLTRDRFQALLKRFQSCTLRPIRMAGKIVVQ